MWSYVTAKLNMALKHDGQINFWSQIRNAM